MFITDAKLVLSSFYLLIVNNDILFEMLKYYISLQTVLAFYDSIRAGTPYLSFYHVCYATSLF